MTASPNTNYFGKDAAVSVKKESMSKTSSKSISLVLASTTPFTGCLSSS